MRKVSAAADALPDGFFCSFNPGSFIRPVRRTRPLSVSFFPRAVAVAALQVVQEGGADVAQTLANLVVVGAER